MTATRGFTLAEIAVSLALVAVCVSGVLLVFPIGVKAQQMARFRLLAAAKAEEMVDAFDTIHDHHTAIDAEAPQPWETTVSRRSMSPDIETRLGNPQTGLLPLPPTIARRLDSDDDEIQRLLDQGGRLYYAQPMATTGIFEVGLGDVTANETQRLVIGVAGYAQSNAVPIFPWKSWPYWTPYPSPPLHGEHLHDARIGPQDKPYRFGRDGTCWEVDRDADIGTVFDGRRDDGAPCGYVQYAYDANAAPDATKAEAYLQACLWYCRRKALPTGFWQPTSTTTPLADFSLGGAVAHADQVNAMRFLAHAGLCLTAWHDAATLRSPGVPIASTSIATVTTPGITVTLDLIEWWHAASLTLAMRFAAEDPYDWGAPRPLQRAQAMDFPLIEDDLFPSATRPLLTGTIGDTGVSAQQWRPIASRPVRHLGRSASFPHEPIPSQDPTDADYAASPTASIWGDPDDFTLCRPFHPSQRCRQLVFWAVDWMSYEDYETAPSAPVDAGRYPIMAPLPGWNYAGRMGGLVWWDFGLHVHRNPEKNLTFISDISGRPTGAAVDDVLMNNAIGSPPDRGDALAARECLLGRWGADRDFDKKLGRGPIPASTRLRAKLVARFNIYDSRVSHALR